MVPLLQFFFLCVSVVSYVAFVLSLFAPLLSFFWWMGKAVLRDRDIFLLSLLILYNNLGPVVDTDCNNDRTRHCSWNKRFVALRSVILYTSSIESYSRLLNTYYTVDTHIISSYM